MILSNWYKLFSNAFCYSNNIETDYYVTNINGTSVRGDNSANIVRFGENSSNYPYIGRILTSLTDSYTGGVILGTGSTAPTANDYKLSSDIITTLTYTSTISRTKNDNGHTLTVLFTITNTASEAITIGELGLIYQGGRDYNYYDTNSRILIERTVLDEPVTIPSQGVGQITYTINLELPIE